MRCSSCLRSVPVADAVRIATPLADAPRPATLTQRASLNVIASLLDYAAKVAAGAALVWLAPTITKVAPALVPVVRLTCALLTASLLFGNLASLPESVLRGMNLGYKRMGLQAGLELVGGALVAGGIYVGLGMAGAAGAQVAFALLMGLCFW